MLAPLHQRSLSLTKFGAKQPPSFILTAEPLCTCSNFPRRRLALLSRTRAFLLARSFDTFEPLSTGPNTLKVATPNTAWGSLKGKFEVYDTDFESYDQVYTNQSTRGTLLYTSPEVNVMPGDVWKLSGGGR